VEDVSIAGFKLRAGDWVEVKDPLEIAQTLDAEGSLDGLPFMPEMMHFCGKRVRVLRLAEKTCVEFPGRLVYKIREFHNNDVVVLDMPRCSGAAHDGCQRACVFFWKQAWLRKTSKDQPGAVANQPGQERLRARLKTMQGPGRYLCQSTALATATHAMTRARVVLKCFYDVASGSRGVLEMAKFVLFPLLLYVRSKFTQRLLAANLKHTPVGNLDLQPGEWVRIKSEVEIATTLDSRACNRGLRCDWGMRLFCGGRYQVRSRLERMISETTGEMRQVGSTVILDGLNCLCWSSHVGGCPREDFMWWREVWLDREQGTGHAVEIELGERLDGGNNPRKKMAASAQERS
jgi:hypothetical protein